MIPFALNSKPAVTVPEAEEFLRANWSSMMAARTKELFSYDSRIYLVEHEFQDAKYILKIANARESRHVGYFECVVKILQHADKNGICTQKLNESTNGNFILNFYENRNDKSEPLKSFLLSYIEGKLLLNAEVNESLCHATGNELLRMTTCIDQISSELEYLKRYYDDNIWNVEKALQIRHFIPYFDCEQKRVMLTSTFDDFEQQIVPNMDKLTRGFIHGDANDMNVIITDNDRIGFIDWQDCGLSFKVYDLSVLIFSLMDINMNCTSSFDFYMVGKHCLRGYQSGSPNPLNETDIGLLPLFVQTRVAMSLCIGYYTNKFINPENEYVLHTQKNGWKILDDLIKNRERLLQEWK